VLKIVILLNIFVGFIDEWKVPKKSIYSKKKTSNKSINFFLI